MNMPVPDNVKVPENCKHLYGALFAVPFSMISVPDDDDSGKEYKFKNPRFNTEEGQSQLVNKNYSVEMRQSIKSRTLLSPLVCRWVVKDGKSVPQLVGGDRRYRAIDFLIKKNEMVADPRNIKKVNDEWGHAQCPAAEAYEYIPCQIFSVSDDLEALALSWAENKGRLNLSEGNEVAEVVKLRGYGAEDGKIIEILQRDEKWLAQTDSLIANLDQNSLSDLLESRIDRASAIELATIKDEEIRNKVRIVANENAQESCKKKIARIQQEIGSALDYKEVAQSTLKDAISQGDEEVIANSQKAMEKADIKVADQIKKMDLAQPVITKREIKQAIAKVNPDLDNRPAKMLSYKKVKDGIEYIDCLLQNNCICLEGTFKTDVVQLNFAKAILENVLNNNPDFYRTILDNSKMIDNQDEE